MRGLDLARKYYEDVVLKNRRTCTLIFCNTVPSVLWVMVQNVWVLMMIFVISFSPNILVSG